MTLKKHFNFLAFFMTFEHQSQVFTPSTLCINSLEEGCVRLPEILTFIYGMKLKLEPMIALDKRRRYMEPSVCWQALYVIYGPDTFR